MVKARLFLVFIIVAPMGCLQRTDPTFLQGQEMYKTYCVACHGVNGGGVLYNKSVLNNDAFVVGDPKEVIAIILYGREGAGTMPSWNQTLDDHKVAAVTTYIRKAWSNRAEAVTAEMVAEIRSKGEKSFPTNPPLPVN